MSSEEEEEEEGEGRGRGGGGDEDEDEDEDEEEGNVFCTGEPRAQLRDMAEAADTVDSTQVSFKSWQAQHAQKTPQNHEPLATPA